MTINKIQDADLVDKKVLLRADFNVAIENGAAKEKLKLQSCAESVDYVTSKQGVKLALISHLGRPEGKVNAEFSLKQLADELETILGKKIVFVDDCIGEKVKNAMESLQEGEILLLENVRFYPGDETNDKEFSKQLAENFDVYINEAFAVSHRNQASVTGVTEFLPSYAGLWLQKEINNLNRVLQEPEHPATAIIGGAKIETKLPLIRRFEKSYDYVLVGGKVANEAMDQKIEFSPKVILPVDFADDRLDIGPNTIDRFKNIINASKLVVWNGPMGKFEEPPYDKGTRTILDAIVENDSFTLVGGGESVQVLEERDLMGSVSFVSTGGGAMLEYLSGNAMPGIEALKTK